MSVTNSTQWILRGLLDLYGCAVPREALDAVLSALQGRGAPRWQFGVSQFSLAFDRHGPPRVRALAEVLTACPVLPTDAHGIEEIGRHLFETLQRQHRLRWDSDLFGELVHATYGSHLPRFRPPDLRFGAAMEWRSGRAPVVTCYFDLFAGGRQNAAERLGLVLDRLHLGRRRSALQLLVDERGEMPPCRLVGIDFAPGGEEHSVRLYLPGARYKLPRLRRLLAACGADASGAELEAFHRHALGGLDEGEAARGMMLGLGLGDRSGAHSPVLRLDGFLPDHHADDFAAGAAVGALASRLEIPLPGHAEALRILAPDTPLAEVQRLHQYCSLDFAETPALTLHLRPLVTRSEHLVPKRRPRRKPPLLAALDGAVRKAIVALEQQPGRLGAHAVEAAIALLLAAGSCFAIDHDRIAVSLDALAARPGDAAAALAPVMHLALLAKAPEAPALCRDILALLFDSVDERLSPRDPAEADEDGIRRRIGDWCAEGAEPAAMAELALALALSGGPRSLGAARAIAAHLSGRQYGNGLWGAGRASDDFRATHLAVRTLSRLAPTLPILARTARGLRAAQRPEGGWGAVGAEPAASASALAACALLQDFDPEGAPVLIRGFAYLLGAQNPDGHWQGGSKATARCLEALVSVRRLVEQGLAAEDRVGTARERTGAGRPMLRVVQRA
jgi:hypothetical protein